MRSPDAVTEVEAEFVVLGGGTSGCVVAGRLAEAGRDVLVVEAGPEYGALDAAGWPDELVDARALPNSHVSPLVVCQATLVELRDARTEPG